MAWSDIVGETDIAYEPAASGTFRVVATAGSCEATSTEVIYTAPASCTGVFTVTLTNDGGTLTATIVDYAGAETPTYEWYLDTGSGLTLLPSETSATLADAALGYYTVVVTIDTCVQTAGLLIQCDFAVIGGGDCVDDSAWSQSFAGDDTSTAFNVTNFYLVDPTYVSAVEIGATYLVQKNGVTLQYSASPADGTTYTIDYANQDIVLNAGFPLLTGETLTIVKLKTVQL